MHTAQQARRYHDNKTAARLINMSESFLNNSRVNGAGPPYTKVGRRVLYEEGDLLAWMDSNRRTSTSDDGAAFQPVAA